MTKQEKINSIQFVIAIMITCIVMFVFIAQKQGWHEDEIFSYGSSNYKYDNLFQRYADKDTFNQVVDEVVIAENPLKTISNLWYYFLHSEEFDEAYQAKRQEEVPQWKTPEHALEYVSVSNDEIFSYWSVHYNQARDVHPPLFYFLVHFVSSLCLNHFSKYIIFSINLLFYIATCFVIRKILQLFGKDYLSGVLILLYGFSMGTISIVMFQRMYMMLTFFALSYLYLNLKIAKNDYMIDKKMKKWLTLTIVLGFLTQYYFCIYVVLLALIVMIVMLRNKQYDSFKRYLWCHIKAAIIGIILFPASIQHIFFSYRGVGGETEGSSYILNLKEFIEFVFYAFSIPNYVGYIIAGILAILLVAKMTTAKRKDIVAFFCFPMIFFFLIVGKIAPYINIRYISILFPMIVIAIGLLLADIEHFLYIHIKGDNRVKKWLGKYQGIVLISAVTLVVSTYGFATSEPEFLYKEYGKRIEIAEEYKNLKLVYVGEAEFVYIRDMEEFLQYKNSLILDTSEVDILKDNEGLEEEQEFILNIKSWVTDPDAVLKEVLEYTDATSYELLLDDEESMVYIVRR